MEDNCGYDNEFVGGLPDYLQCAICCLALKNPIQLISCGHRFCRLCFETMKEHSLQNNVDVLCPIDRSVVDVSKIFEDKGIERLVFDLQVKCPCNAEGCNWIGDLRNLEAHERHKCSFEEKKRTQQILKDLLKRLESCEKQLEEKDESIGDIRVKFSVSTNKINADMKALQRQLENCQKELLEAKVELNLLKKGDQSVHPDNRKKRKLETNHLDSGEHSACTQDDLQQTAKDIFHDEENIQPIETGLKDVILEQHFYSMFKEVTSFQRKMNIVKQVMSNKTTTFKWHLKNYDVRRRQRVATSPCFYTGPYGHCCRLQLEWTGEQLDNLGIYFQIVTGNKENRNPLSSIVLIEIADKNGLKKPFGMSSSLVRKRQADFEHPGRGGKKEFIKMPELQDFVVNDCMFISCQLFPSLPSSVVS